MDVFHIVNLFVKLDSKLKELVNMLSMSVQSSQLEFQDLESFQVVLK
jgi:hypothetical protein